MKLSLQKCIPHIALIIGMTAWASSFIGLKFALSAYSACRGTALHLVCTGRHGSCYHAPLRGLLRMASAQGKAKPVCVDRLYFGFFRSFLAFFQRRNQPVCPKSVFRQYAGTGGCFLRRGLYPFLPQSDSNDKPLGLYRRHEFCGTSFLFAFEFAPS